MISPVFISTVVDHIIPTSVLHIDIDIRHRDAVRIKEALKQQAVLQRVQVSDPDGVRDDRPRRRPPPRAKDIALRLAPVNEVLNDQEIALIAHRTDHT